MNDFYIGYLPTAPAPLRTILERTVRLLLIGVVVLAILLVKAQQPFAASAFEFQQARDFEGTIEAQPYPALLIPRPGADSLSRYLLVAPGKHGAEDLLRPYYGRAVRLQGRLIYREEGTMIEVVPGSVQGKDRAAAASDIPDDLGPATLSGEIVDTKCFLGVMNPGNGKVHRECAARCLSGGIPAAFLADSAADGENRLYVLTAGDGGLLPRTILVQRAGERITVTGRIMRIGSVMQFRVDPRTL